MPDGADRPRILAQHLDTAMPRPWMRLGGIQWFAVAVLALTGVAAFGIAPESTLDVTPGRTIVTALPLPPLAIAPGDGARYWREERVQRGDTIGSLLARAGVDDASAMAFLRTDLRARALYQLKPGRPIRVATDDEGRLQALRFLNAEGDLLAIERVNEAFFASYEPTTQSVRMTLKSGEIESSLFGAADAADIPDAVTTALADLFAGDIDFLHDVRRGDRFSVLYETRYVEGEPIATGRIVAAQFDNDGQSYRAFLWQDAEGNDAWYSDDGRSMRKAFLRSPMEFTRMTSGFSRARFHPILQTWRAHRGVDYAAPTGTPVRATADGVVAMFGTQNGYGNVVVIKHQGVHSTLYAHLSRFPTQLRLNGKVRQGEVIGYVGSTGWATGPHLHCEFRVNDEARDPLKVAMPYAGPLPPETRANFEEHIAPLAAQLQLAREFAPARFASRD